jgi:hypothetical protein
MSPVPPVPAVPAAALTAATRVRRGDRTAGDDERQAHGNSAGTRPGAYPPAGHVASLFARWLLAHHRSVPPFSAATLFHNTLASVSFAEKGPWIPRGMVPTWLTVTTATRVTPRRFRRR